jgi:hypothetical protein
MSVQQTSLEAYQSIKYTGVLGNSQKIVYLALKDLGAANNLIISKKLGWGINRITGRINELRKFGYVIEDELSPRDCPITKRKTMFWRVR